MTDTQPTDSVPTDAAASTREHSDVRHDSIIPEEISMAAFQSSARASTALMIASWTRLLALVPVIGLLTISAVLVLVTSKNVIHATKEAITGSIGLVDLAVEYVEFTDMYLLGIALFIMALGMFSLFITDRIPMPEWLDFHDFDDLKERLVSVIVVMLGVYFFGEVLKGAHGIDLLWLGFSIGAIIIALSIFMRFVFQRHKHDGDAGKAPVHA